MPRGFSPVVSDLAPRRKRVTSHVGLTCQSGVSERRRHVAPARRGTHQRGAGDAPTRQPRQPHLMGPHILIRAGSGGMRYARRPCMKCATHPTQPISQPKTTTAQRSCASYAAFLLKRRDAASWQWHEILRLRTSIFCLGRPRCSRSFCCFCHCEFW